MKTKVMLAIAMATAFPAIALFAQEPSAMQGMDDQRHREMMPIHAKMQEEQKKLDAELDPLLAAMNSATGEKRIDAIMAVLNKLVEQRRAMHDKMSALLDK